MLIKKYICKLSNWQVNNKVFLSYIVVMREREGNKRSRVVIHMRRKREK